MGKKEDKKIENSLKSLARTSFIVFIGILLSKLFSYLYRIIIARTSGPEEYGLFSLAVVILGLTVAISSMGVGDSLVRFIPIFRGRKQNEKIKYIIRWTFSVIALSSIVFGIALFFLAEYISIGIFHNEKLVIYLKVFSFLVPVSILGHNFLDVLKAYEYINWYSFIFNIFQNLVKLVVLVLLIWFGIFNSGNVIFSYVSGMLSILILGYFVSKKKIRELFKKDKLKISERKELRKETLNYSVPLVFSAIIGILFYWVDSLSLGYLKDITAVGFYNAAVPIAMLLSFVPEIFMQLFRPLISKEFGRNDKKTVEEISKQVSKWIFIFIVPLFILLFFFPGAALKILFGESFLIAENALRILSFGMVISALSVVPNNLLLMKGKSGILFFDIFLFTLVNIILNWIFIPLPNILWIDNNSGLVGAASSTVVSIGLMGITLFVQSIKYTGVIPLRRKMLAVAISAAISLATLAYIKQFFIIDFISIIILSIIFGIIYIAMILISKSLDRNDYMIIKSIVRKIYK